MNPYQTRYGLEALNYQGPKAPLAVALNTLFDGVFAYKESLKGSNQEKVRQVRSYVQAKGFQDEFKKIVLKYTGLDLKLKLFGAGPLYVFAISFQPADELLDGYGGLEHSTWKTEFTEDQRLQDELEAVRNSLDMDTGILTDPKAANKVISEKALMYFCIDTAFCLDNYHEQARPLITEEITAIVLHEIGHVLSVIHYANTLYTDLNELTAPLKLSAKTPNAAKQSVRKMQAVVARGEKMDAEKKTSSKVVQAARGYTKAVEDILNDKPSVNLFWAALSWLLIGIGQIIFFPLTILIGLNMIEEAVWQSIRESKVWRTKPKLKDSDVKHTYPDITAIEFRADEYVNSFGLSPYLVTGLDKLTDSSLIVPPANRTAPYYKGSCMFTYNFQHVMSLVMAPYYGVLEEHGFTDDRYGAIRRNILKAMNIEDLPDYMADDLIRQYSLVQDSLKAIAAHRKKYHTDYERYGKFAVWFINGGTIGQLLRTGKKDKDYLELLELGKNIQDNELVYYQKVLERRKK